MKKKVYAYLHTHWDREWYREFEEFRVRLIEVFDDVLDKLESNEIPSFYFDGQTLAIEDYFELRPEKKDIVRKLIKEKRLFIGPFFCSTDSFLVDAEALINNLQTGIKYSKEYGCNDFIAYHADTFGHSAHIPRIIKYFGIPYAMFWRGLGELESEFKFNGLDSVYLIEGYFHDYFSIDADYEKKVQMLKRTIDRIAKYSSDTILLPIGADHLAVADNIQEQIKEVNKRLEDYEIILATPFDYLRKVKNNFKKNIKTEFRDTKRNFILPGVLSSRIDLKQQNSKYQWQLGRVYQPMQAITSFLNLTKSFQREIDYAYRLLLLNQPHDSIYGCSIDNVHKENQTRFLKLKEVLNSVSKSIERDLYSDNKLSVVNLSNFDFCGALKIVTDKKLPDFYNAQLIKTIKGFPDSKVYPVNKIPVTEDYTNLYEYLIDIKNVKRLSSKQVDKRDINTKSSLKITSNSIENDCIKLYVNRGKIFVTDKKTNKTYKDFIQFTDRADTGDSYNFGALKNDKPLNAKILKSKIIEKGSIRSILEIQFEIFIPEKSTDKGRSTKNKRHIIKTDVILENQNDYAEFIVNWQNKSTDHILQVKFNMESPVVKTISDDLAGYMTREFDADYDIYKHIPAPRGIELKHNTAPIQKCLWTQGLGIITEGLQEYEVFKNELCLTILRATGTISNPHNPTRGTPAGPPLPTPDLQMLKENTARFAICFSKDIKQMQSNTEKFYCSTLLLGADLENLKLFDSGNKNILLSTAKLDNNNNITVRFINKSDKPEVLRFSTQLPYKAIYLTDAMEDKKLNKIKEFEPIKIDANSFITLKLKYN